MEEFVKFNSEMAVFKTWLEKAYNILEDKERKLANLNNVQGNIDDIKDFVSDVMTHGADLKFLTISGQKFVDLSKVGTHPCHFLRLCLFFHAVIPCFKSCSKTLSFPFLFQKPNECDVDDVIYVSNSIILFILLIQTQMPYIYRNIIEHILTATYLFI